MSWSNGLCGFGTRELSLAAGDVTISVQRHDIWDVETAHSALDSMADFKCTNGSALGSSGVMPLRTPFQRACEHVSQRPRAMTPS